MVTGDALAADFVFPPRPRRGVARRPRGLHGSYASQRAVLGTPARRTAAGLAVAGAAAIPFVVGPVGMRVLTLAAIAAIGAVALNLLAGMAGQLSLAHAGFLGIGAYTAGYGTVELGLPFLLTLPLAGLVAGAACLLLVPAVLRVRGLGVAVVTLGFVFVMQHLFRAADGVTGGTRGRRVLAPELFEVNLVRADQVAGRDIAPGGLYWYLVVVVLIVVMVGVKNVQRHRMGRAMAAVRDHDLAAGALGVPVQATRARAFLLSSAITGIAGALLGGLLRVVGLDQWDLFLSVDYLAMVVIGGLGTVLGGVLGAAFVVGLPHALDQLVGVVPVLSGDGTGLTPTLLARIVFGLTLVAVIVAEPRGLVAVWSRLRGYFRTWPFRR